MIELLTKRWYYPGNATEGKILINDAEGDGGNAVRQFPPVPANTVVVANMTIDSISSGRIRFNIAGQLGTWRSTAGTYQEYITSSGDDHVTLVYDSFTVATIDERTLSIGIPEEGD